MASQNRKAIKEINGYRVNHPYSGSNIFYAILIMIIIVLPAAALFVPFLTYKDYPLADSIAGIDIIKFGFNGFKLDGLDAALQLKFSAYFLLWGSTLANMAEPMMITVTALYLIIFVIAFIALIELICILAKGYLRHARGVKTLSLFSFLFFLFIALVFTAIFMTAVFTSGIKCEMIPWFGFIAPGAALIVHIFVASVHNAFFVDCVQEKDLEYHEDAEGQGITDVTKVHNVTKIVETPSNVLPNNLTSIGGHAFSQNQHLEIANIPLGIEVLGNGAFSNCLNLKVVSLPTSIKEIGFNCFFNCTSLERLNYAGSKEEWKKIKRGSNWLAKAKTTEVICNDGVILVHPYH